MKTLDQICDNIELNISLVTYMRLGRILRLGCEQAVPVPGSAHRNLGLNSTFTGQKKGSQAVRKLLLINSVEKSKEQLMRLRQVQTFFHLIELRRLQNCKEYTVVGDCIFCPTKHETLFSNSITTYWA
jgi:hypothetical protein